MKAVIVLLIVSFYAYAFSAPQYYNFGAGKRAARDSQGQDASSSHFQIPVYPTRSELLSSQFNGEGAASPNTAAFSVGGTAPSSDSSNGQSFGSFNAGSGSSFNAGIPGSIDPSSGSFNAGSVNSVPSPNSNSGLDHFTIVVSSAAASPNADTNQFDAGSFGIVSPTNSDIGVNHFKVGDSGTSVSSDIGSSQFDPTSSVGSSQFDPTSSVDSSQFGSVSFGSVASTNSNTGSTQQNVSPFGSSSTLSADSSGNEISHFTIEGFKAASPNSGSATTNFNSGSAPSSGNAEATGPAGVFNQNEAGVEPIKIIRNDNQISEDGGYTLDLETADGLVRSEKGTPGVDGAINQEGSISFTYPNGEPFILKFVADENGYHPESDSIPVAPEFPHEIPQFVLDQIEKAKQEDERFDTTESTETY